MSIKPTVLPRWATDVAAAIVVPTGGKMDLGWDAVNGERPPGEYLNFLQFHTYEWLQYLKDGAFQGDSSFDSDLTVLGSLLAPTILAGTIDCSGLIHTAGDITVGDDVTVGGDLVVTGSITAGKIVESATRMLCDPASAEAVASVGTQFPLFDGDAWQFGIQTTGVFFPMKELKAGQRIIWWQGYYTKHTSAATTVTISLQEYDLTTRTWSVVGAAQTDSRDNPGNAEKHAAVSITVALDKKYAVVMTGGGSSGDRAEAAFIDFDRL